MKANRLCRGWDPVAHRVLDSGFAECRTPGRVCRVTYEQLPDEWKEWLDLTPLERFHQSEMLFAQYLAMGGSLDPDPDPTGPFDDPQASSAGATPSTSRRSGCSSNTRKRRYSGPRGSGWSCSTASDRPSGQDGGRTGESRQMLRPLEQEVRVGYWPHVEFDRTDAVRTACELGAEHSLKQLGEANREGTPRSSPMASPNSRELPRRHEGHGGGGAKESPVHPLPP